MIERERDPKTEVDGLRWYTDFQTCDEVLYEKYFYCNDLGRDLVPVGKEYQASEECETVSARARALPCRRCADQHLPLTL